MLYLVYSRCFISLQSEEPKNLCLVVLCDLSDYDPRNSGVKGNSVVYKDSIYCCC